MPHAVTITGSRRTEHRQPAEYGLLFDAYLRPFAGKGSHVYVGGALGIDTLALGWLVEHSRAALTVVVPCTLADQPEAARHTVLSATGRAQRVALVELGAPDLSAEAYHTRNRLVRALRDPQCLDVEGIDHLAASVSEVDHQISSVPFIRLQLLLAPIIELCARLQDTEPLRGRLGALRCDAYLLAGRIAFETRDDAAARR